MHVAFTEKDHKYVDDAGVQYTSITTLLGEYKEKFNEIRASESCVLREDGKWYGMVPAEVRKIWQDERDRSTTLGTWYHKLREDELVEGIQCPIVDGVKMSLPQELQNGIYPEFIVYYPEYQIAGQIDYLQIDGNKFRIRDYKTSKEIRATAFRDKKMKYPLNNVPDCSLYHYAMQLSLYANMITFWNPKLQVDELIIEHVVFEVEKMDDNGYPIYKINSDGEFIIKSVTPIKVPYMLYEVRKLLKVHAYILEQQRALK